VLTDDAERAERLRSSMPADRAIVGSPAEIVDVIAGYTELGLDEFIVPDFALGRETSERREAYERFRAEVTTAFA